MKHPDFEVVVIGGGHAGVEAAHASVRAGAKTAMVTLRRDGIGIMSCNPAIGGLGKGHLVREIDALGGVMGLAADYSGIQFRLLNRRKGPAVQGPRTQSDRALYQEAILEFVENQNGLSVIEGEVADLIVTDHRVSGVALADGSQIACRAVVITTGTFLRGVIHMGEKQRPAGRVGDKPSVKLAERLEAFGLPLGRLKTGTPPRLRASSIDWDRLQMQPADDEPTVFSFLNTKPAQRQIACGITHTNANTHVIIQENLGRSAMYGGHIKSSGPRYCPSIEDKVVRFADKDSHQIFLEPEGLTSDLVYPNGISTSLPADVQEAYVRSIVGLEQAEITQPGYAIEYDYVDPRSLDERLGLRALPGCFLAGQINGTTGYEEAGGQGLIAGLNAAFEVLGQAPLTLRRDEAYIGVMIDDLVTKGVAEPYRMFTSRAEYRLSLRADNADQRLTPIAEKLGVIDEQRRGAFDQKMERLAAVRAILSGMNVTPTAGQAAGLDLKQDGQRRDGLQLLAFPGIEFDDLIPLEPGLAEVDAGSRRQVEIDALYATYVARQSKDAESLKRDEGQPIPSDLDYADISGLSNELRGKLQTVQPRTLGQAGRIEGMTPAALALILTTIRRRELKSA